VDSARGVALAFWQATINVRHPIKNIFFIGSPLNEF
jgi:hypothetical protein